MTARAWRLPEAARVAALVDGAPAGERADFWGWFDPVFRQSPGCEILDAALACWARVVNDEKILAWWESGAGKVALPRALLRRGLAGAARIDGAEGGRFSFAPGEGPGGAAAVTWLAHDPAAGALDLLALDPADPARCWRMTGAADCLPSADLLERALDAPDGLNGKTAAPVIRLHEYPLAWLAGGAAPGSFCVLDWRAMEAQALLSDINCGSVTVVCDSDGHARRLRARARPKRPAMLLRVADGGREAAPSAGMAPGGGRGEAPAAGGAKGPARAGSETVP